MSDEGIYWALTLVGLSAGFAGLAWGAWLDRADRTRRLLLASLDRHVKYPDGR